MTDDFVRSMVDQAAWDLAARREDILREAARERLPRLLRWTVDKPRILGLLYALHGAWRPTIVYGADGHVGVACVQREDGTVAIVQTFGVKGPPGEQDARP